MKKQKSEPAVVRRFKKLVKVRKLIASQSDICPEIEEIDFQIQEVKTKILHAGLEHVVFAQTKVHKVACPSAFSGGEQADR